MTRNAKAGRSQNVSVLTRRSRLILAVLPSVKIRNLCGGASLTDGHGAMTGDTDVSLKGL